MARFAITAEARQRLQETDPRWRSKAILRAAATFLDFIAIILFAISVRMTVDWEKQWNDGIGDDWTDGMPLAPVGIIYVAHRSYRKTSRLEISPIQEPPTNTSASLQVLLSFLYNPIVLFLLLRHRRGRPYHPGWDVTFDLLIWALSVPSIVFSVGDGWWWWWQPVEFEFEPYDIVPCSFEYGGNVWSQPCQPSIYTIGKIEIAANVFLALIL